MTGATTGRAATARGGGVSRLGRSDRTAVGRWFWEIDRLLLLLVFVLICIGLVAVAAASPAAASRYSDGAVQIGSLYYFKRQLIWVALALPVMIAVSMLSKDLARRFALGGAAFFSVLLAAVPLIGSSANGSTRWIGVGSVLIQPSEFLKPLFVVTIAWLFSLGQQDRTLPVIPLSAILLVLISVLLMKQPDFGQTIIYGAAWVVLLAFAGVSARLLGGLGVLGMVGVVAAYFFYPVATTRIDAFLYGHGDSYQTTNALHTLMAGGVFGAGPGEGVMKFRLPEPHTDYIFSVIGEEFGAIACFAVALIYLAIVARVILKLLEEEDNFVTLAAAGLVTEFGMQALINMLVNIKLAPSKGMTLPFISYGGSSMVALSIGFGLLLAFTRRNPYLNRSPYVVKWSGK
jgi:cell division protein FtsW